MKKITVAAFLILLSMAVLQTTFTYPLIGQVGTGVAIPTTAIKSWRSPGDENVTSYPLSNPDFSSKVYDENPRNWWTQKGGTGSGNIGDNWYSTSGYKVSPCVGIYMSQSYNTPKNAYEYWYQDWLYNGSIPPTSANVTFKWKFSAQSGYRLPGSNNTLSIWIQYPAGSGSGTSLLRRMINGTSSWVANQWYTETVPIKDYLTASSNTTKYRIMLRLDCQTATYASTGYFYTYWDDVIISARYAPLFGPRDLKLSIIGTSTEKNFTNSRSVVLGVSGRSLNRLGFSNDMVTWQLFDPADTVNWTLSPGDGVKTVWFNASNSKGTAGPVNNTIFCDTIGPPLPLMIECPANGSQISDRKPTFKWTCEDFQPGSNVTHYEIWISRSTNFESTAEGKNITDLPYNIYTFEELGDGTWYWRIRAVDRAGNNGTWVIGSFNLQVMNPWMVYLVVGGGTGGVIFLFIIAFYYVKRARIPIVIKKIDQSIKLIGKGEMPKPVPMRSRAQILGSLFQSKLEIMSKEKLEEAVKKKQGEKTEAAVEKGTMEGAPYAVEATPVDEAKGTDVDVIAKELEKLETKSDKQLSEETDLIRQEIEKLEKSEKKKKSD